MVELVKTVKVRSGDSYAIIRRADYDPKVHELVDEAEEDRGAKARRALGR